VKVEAALQGRPASKDVVAAAVKDAGDGIADINSDIHGSAEYRRAMIQVFARRALSRALERT
jgi:carbon-monoxide dehydrogenase medium subunit